MPGLVEEQSSESKMMTRPDNSIDMFLRAYHTAISGRPGPVVIQIPFDIQNTPISDALPDQDYVGDDARDPEAHRRWRCGRVWYLSQARQ